ncbi:GxxExxY protein [Botrimarina sp.]|uniref:GxxExxY protein n=1 Tax=Botrimarina sp. TaxID=2795802 RepID=UPI0032EA9AB2
MPPPIPRDIESVGTKVLDAAFAVHRELGPGLLESVYETCLCHELRKLGIDFVAQAQLPIFYDGIRIESGLRLDLLVAGSVIVELKAIDQMAPIHEAQLLTYMKLANVRLGFLLNFNSIMLRDGMKRLVL